MTHGSQMVVLLITWRPQRLVSPASLLLIGTGFKFPRSITFHLYPFNGRYRFIVHPMSTRTQNYLSMMCHFFSQRTLRHAKNTSSIFVTIFQSYVNNLVVWYLGIWPQYQAIINLQWQVVLECEVWVRRHTLPNTPPCLQPSFSTQIYRQRQAKSIYSPMVP